MATNAQFATTARCDAIDISTANTSRTGSGTIVQFMLAGASGSRVERIRIKAQGTTTTGMVRIFTWDGSTYRLFEEVSVSAVTPSGTVESFEATINLGSAAPLFLPDGSALGASTNNAEAFIVTAIGGDF